MGYLGYPLYKPLNHSKNWWLISPSNHGCEWRIFAPNKPHVCPIACWLYPQSVVLVCLFHSEFLRLYVYIHIVKSCFIFLLMVTIPLIVREWLIFVDWDPRVANHWSYGLESKPRSQAGESKCWLNVDAPLGWFWNWIWCLSVLLSKTGSG